MIAPFLRIDASPHEPRGPDFSFMNQELAWRTMADLAAALAAGGGGRTPDVDARAAYEHARSARSAAHAQMTRFTAALGAADGPLETVRNAVLRAVPTALNTAIFDAALRRSLGGGGD